MGKAFLKVKNKIFFFKVFFYFSVFLFLIGVIMISTYKIMNLGVKKQFYDKIQYNLLTASTTVDTQIEIVQNMGLNFFTSDYVKQYFKPESAITPSLKAEQWRIMRVISQNEAIFGELINKDYVFFCDGTKVYAGAGIYDKDFFFENICNYQKYPYDYWTKLTSGNRNMRVLTSTEVLNTFTNETKKVIPVVTFQRIRGQDVIYTSNISSEKVENMLKSSAVIDSTEFLILDRQANILLDTNQESLKQEEIEWLQASLPDENSQLAYTRGKQKYLTFSRASDYSGLVYISMVPMNAFNQVMSMNLYLIIGTGIMMLLVGVSLALMFSMRIYRPIHSVVDILVSNDKCQTDENKQGKGVDEIQFLKQGVKLLLDNEQQYQKRLIHYDMEYAEHSLRLIINGIATSKYTHLSQTLQTLYHFEYNTYVCCNILFDYTLEFYQKIEEMNQREVMNQFRVVLEALINKTQKCCVLEMQNGMYTCIINTESHENMTRIIESFKIFESIFKNDIDYYSVYIGIGDVCDMNKLAVSYHQAMTALQNRSKKQDYQIIQFNKLPIKSQVVFSFYDQKKIVNFILNGTKEELNQLVSDILNENKNRGITYPNMIELYKQIWSVGQRCLEEQGKKIEDLEITQTITSIEQQKDLSFDESKHIVLNFLNSVLEYIRLEGICSGNKIVNQIQRYVAEHYAQDLCLEQIASELDISAKYISRVFKQKCGENLTEYINQIRISKAKEILVTTNTKIGEIASMVGIESRSTFLRVFKKLEGVSPNEYRMAYVQLENVEQD